MADRTDPVDDAAVDDYALGVAVLQALVAELPAHPPVTLGRMFNGDGVKVREKIFAFIGRNGDLVAKVPEPRVLELVSLHTGAPVVMGRRTMREWVRLPAKAGVAAWGEVLDEAYRFGLTRPLP
ncbi:hypothetical protein BJQ94_05650 [Cryobacterium sp. SO2]|uniref:hypothetical protein n=1 Tax=Cryobacterium sp. SO2 TaxID=1897060 RepID=UPI00223E86BF|nr:hypothetical protein [Cryobacterium sp. SO2]WEO78522.1 hypothetical protein BJQ94_05650 [Cryobacterium sp. SO2]